MSTVNYNLEWITPALVRHTGTQHISGTTPDLSTARLAVDAVVAANPAGTEVVNLVFVDVTP